LSKTLRNRFDDSPQYRIHPPGRAGRADHPVCRYGPVSNNAVGLLDCVVGGRHAVLAGYDGGYSAGESSRRKTDCVVLFIRTAAPHLFNCGNSLGLGVGLDVGWIGTAGVVVVIRLWNRRQAP